MCPLNASVPISAGGVIPVAPADVATIPSIAYGIPDFEGQAILRIFANSTESEIGCYTGVITNGKTFSQPNSVGTILGICALVAMITSFATAIYGEAVPTMRLHYAHSLSVGVVMAVFQHIFFSGALSVNWPSVLVAWWSNFAWAGGMIYSSSMQNSINSLIGNDIGNTSQVGAAPAGSTQDNLGGGYDISQIYGRSLIKKASQIEWPSNHPLRRSLRAELFSPTTHDLFERDVVERALYARDAIASKTDGYNWYGSPVGSGLPLPGNYSGFAGTLATRNIRVSNAFMTGFLWFLILLVIVTFAVIAFKWTLEGLARVKAIKPDRLKFFRDHWRRYATAVALRTCYLGFFMLMFLTIFQFTYDSSASVKAIAAIVFVIFIIGIPGIAAYAFYYKRHFTGKHATGGPAQVEHKKLLGVIPVVPKKTTRALASEAEQLPDSKSSTKPFWKREKSADSEINPADDVDNIHDYDDYTMKFGWLVSRFRRTRWWFFTVWIFYELLRAIFYGAASGYALAQVFGLLIIEFLAFVYIIWARPFEGRRLNFIVVYCLGFSKVASVALSAAFDVSFNLPRIITTVIGIVIIVIQGILTIITIIAVIVGAISSYMSVSRNHEDFRPRKWHGMREKYFNHLDRVVNDLPREKKVKPVKVAQHEPVGQKEGFEMKGMRRLAKIEDEDEEFASEMRTEDPDASYMSLNNRGGPSSANFSEAAIARRTSGTASPAGRSRAASLQSQSNLPYGARPHRPSWTTRDFSPTGAESPTSAFTPIDMSKTVPDDEAPAPSSATKVRHKRSASLTSAFKPAPKQKPLKPNMSAESLHIGGDVSTRDTIGRVPAPPPMRPRSSAQNSLRNSRSGTPVHGFDFVDDGQPGSARGSRYPLTPAQEMDEWGIPKTSQEEK